MATVALVGLLYTCCELYIDDVCVFGATEDEYFENLEKVLQRFIRHKMTFKPSKMKLGLTQIEYVGHVIDAEGLHFSREKICEVADWMVPSSAKQLRSFLGLANYFRDHVRGFSPMDHPLRQVLNEYNRTKRYVWTEEATASFNAIKMAIRECPKLYFISEGNGPVFLHTDASDYGIGAYLFQMVDGDERPVALFSKSLVKEQLRWSVPEKECFAIVAALENSGI